MRQSLISRTNDSILLPHLNKMNHRFPSSLFLPLSIIFVLQVMLQIPLSLGYNGPYEDCRDAQFKCGNITARYPFSGYGIPGFCGHPHLKLDCDDNNITTIEIVDVKYQVLEIPIQRDGQTPRMRIARQEYIKHNDICKPESRESTFDYGPFELVDTRGYANVTLLYDCPKFTQPFPEHFNCSGKGDNYDKDIVFWVVSEVPGSVQCSANVTVPILQSFLVQGMLNQSNLLQGLKKGFDVKWKQQEQEQQVCETCKGTGGSCGFGDALRTTCYCPNATIWQKTTTVCPRLTPAIAPTPTTGKDDNKRISVSLGIGLGIAGAAITSILLGMGMLRFRRKSRDLPRRGPPIATASVEAFIKNFGSLAPKRYSYGDIKKMTNKFKDKLGQGGYGSVYKGKLSDDRLVAVKVLSESKGNGEDFMNEVASIGRTSHINIVSLLGFCYDRSKRALIYELMPHGSLDKYIYKQGSENQSRQLEWQTLHDIALSIAKGLEYLHQGCNTRILHFDIKPHNILLDENFCPKISDFGLSKLCERKESNISMTGARGTIGYIAPEVFCRNFGGVSYKSDVYSYGMMVLEMVGGRRNIKVEVSESSQIYFPSWIYNNFEQEMSLSLDGVRAGEEEEIARKLIVVSLWCIQTNPSDRPSMSKVLDMLQGSLQSLVIPPNPFVSSLT